MRIEMGGRVLERKVGDRKVNLKDLIESLQRGLLPEGWVIMEVVLDGKQLTAFEFEARAEDKLPESSELKLVLKSTKELLAKTLGDGDEFHRSLEQACLKADVAKPLGPVMEQLREWMSFWRAWYMLYPRTLREIEVDRVPLIVWVHRGRRAAGEATALWRAEMLPVVGDILMHEVAPFVAMTRKALKPFGEVVSRIG